MPRFLNTWTGEFEWHPDPRYVTYAILSHVWRGPGDGGEQSYDDIRKIQAAVKEDRREEPPSHLAIHPISKIFSWKIFTGCTLRPTPHTLNTPSPERDETGTIFSRPELSDKIKGFCKVAREAGFRLAWNDACCIDKTSSAELSEAINSMYEWYRLSDMCYVYLADVPDGDSPISPISRFSQSHWHTRGWTLQELIAPERVVFLTNTWSFLGTKKGLAKTLQKVTGVAFDVLTGRASLESVSVARRMSWAAKRSTTRLEDQAYCLMGIFGVHMSPIYGEGENAFYRLQEEIIRTIPDHSIFGWGRGCTMLSLARCTRHGRVGQYSPALLASSPLSFTWTTDITPITPSHLATSLHLKGGQNVPPIHCNFTPEGVCMRLLCLTLDRVPLVHEALRELMIETPQSTCAELRECSRLGEVSMLAMLQCSDEYGGIIALPLCQHQQGGKNDRNSHIGTHVPCMKGHRAYRTVSIRKRALSAILKHVQPEVVEVLLVHHCSSPSIPKSLQPDGNLPGIILWPGNRPGRVTFKLAPHCVDALSAQGFSPSPLLVEYSEREISLRTTLTHHSDSGGYRLQGLQALELRLLLKSRGPEDTEVLFFVNGKVDISLPLFGSTPHTWKVDPNFEDRNGIPGSGSAPREGRSALHPSRRTVAHAVFTVRSDANREEHTLDSIIRPLRIALELPFEGPACQYASHLWLAVDLSEEYWQYTRPIESGADASSPERTERDTSPSAREHDGVAQTRVLVADEYARRRPVRRRGMKLKGLRPENDTLRARAQVADLSPQHAPQMHDTNQKICALHARFAKTPDKHQYIYRQPIHR